MTNLERNFYYEEQKNKSLRKIRGGGKALTLLLVIATLITLCSCKDDIKISNIESDGALSSDQSEAADKTTDSSSEEASTKELIDLDALNAIEATDNFGLKVIKKELKRDINTFKITTGNDGLLLTIENNLSYKVKSFTVHLVAYTSSNELAAFDNQISIMSELPYVKTCTMNNEINSGEAFEFYIECDADKFDNVKVIVSSYKDSTDKEYKNDILDKWLESYQLGKNTVLE